MNESLMGDNPSEPKDFLAELVGDDKKFKDVQSLAKGKYEADRFIEMKNRQFDDLREDYLKLIDQDKTRARLEDLVAQLEGKSLEGKQPEPKMTNEPTYKLEDIKNLAKETYVEEERARQQQANFNTVKAKLEEQYGDQYAPYVRERVKELGLTPEELNDLARRSPNAAINALGLNLTKPASQSVPTSSRTFKPSAEQKKTWSYYQELKKTNPKLYTNPKIINEMIQQAELLGDAFNDGDF